jgi:rare lipoprotein A
MNMNQHRWTCLATVVLTTVGSPIAAVSAKISSPTVGFEDYYLLPQSLPKITPLRVTELQTDTVLTVNTQLVPQVTKLPIITPLNGKIQAQAALNPRKVAERPSVKKLLPLSPVELIRSTVPSSTPDFQATESLVLLANPDDTTIVPVNPVAPLPSLSVQTPTPQSFTPVTVQATTAPIPVVRNGNQLPTQITVATTAEAQIPHVWQTQDSGVGMGKSPNMTVAAGTTINKSQLNSAPQVTPTISRPKDRSDLPDFEAGSPVFIFNNQPAQKIVATAIAQVGDTIVAPEPSIAIPIQRPKQPTTPAPAVAPSNVNFEQPAATVKPVLDQIVATQTGQASWYGSEGGSKTANGEKYNPNGLTAAHRTLPFGTKVRITSIKTGKTVTVRINDRGPFRSRRIVDISAGAAEVIGIKADGVGDVRMDILAAKG